MCVFDCYDSNRPPQRKFKSSSIENQLKVFKKVDAGIEKAIAAEFDIPASTLSTIIKRVLSNSK